MTAYATAPDKVRIAYETAGEGPPILLIHGFASDRVQNWRAPGWYDTLTRAGYRVIAMDCRGHGESDKPHDPSKYDHDIMAADAIAVLDVLGIERANVMGYSMGGFLALRLAVAHGARLVRLIAGGIGGSYLAPQTADQAIADPERRNLIAEALLAPDKSAIANPTARAFRDFAEQPGKDRLALAACMRADRKSYDRATLATVRQPVLIVCGETDTLTGAPDPLAAAFPNGRAVTIPKRDHMTTVGDKLYKQAVIDFLAAN